MGICNKRVKVNRLSSRALLWREDAGPAQCYECWRARLSWWWNPGTRLRLSMSRAGMRSPGWSRRINGVFGGCWCMGFHPDDSRDPALNRERKLARVRAGRAHAALVFDRDDCVGWCQFGAPDEVPKIKNRAAYES